MWDTNGREESYEDFENRIIQRAIDGAIEPAAERALEILEDQFKHRVKRFIIRKVLSSGWTVVTSICAWEIAKALKLPHWFKDVFMSVMGG